ncbi:MAG: hypothetical protein ACYDHT_00835 [Solirubrobacteraceae bacterium]
MTRPKSIVLCVLVALTVGLIASATASATAPEFGRCIKKAKAEGAGYGDGKCTEAVGSGAKFEWSPGPGPKANFSAAERFIPTPPYKHCLRAREDEEAGDFEGAKKIYEQYGLTKEGCEVIIEKEEGKEPAIFETTGGLRTECGGVSTTGEYTGTKNVNNVKTVFTECLVSETELACSSAGAAAGEIVTTALKGELGIIKTEGVPKNNKIGLDLSASSGEVIAEFSCGIISGVAVKGSFIHQIKSNAMVLEENEKVTQRKGFQKPEKFEGEPVDVLLTSFGGGSPIQSGIGLRTRLTNEEKIEANSVV